MSRCGLLILLAAAAAAQATRAPSEPKGKITSRNLARQMGKQLGNMAARLDQHDGHSALRGQLSTSVGTSAVGADKPDESSASTEKKTVGKKIEGMVSDLCKDRATHPLCAAHFSQPPPNSTEANASNVSEVSETPAADSTTTAAPTAAAATTTAAPASGHPLTAAPVDAAKSTEQTSRAALFEPKTTTAAPSTTTAQIPAQKLPEHHEHRNMETATGDWHDEYGHPPDPTTTTTTTPPPKAKDEGKQQGGEGEKPAAATGDAAADTKPATASKPEDKKEAKSAARPQHSAVPGLLLLLLGIPSGAM